MTDELTRDDVIDAAIGAMERNPVMAMGMLLGMRTAVQLIAEGKTLQGIQGVIAEMEEVIPTAPEHRVLWESEV